MVISVKGTYTIKPAGETPKGLMYASDIDNVGPQTLATFIFFFRRPTCDSSLNPFETTRRSLTKLVSIFYPLAGRLQWTSDSSKERVEINCNSAGASLVEAESDSTVEDFGDFCPTAEVEELLPAIDYKSLPLDQQPLLMVQLTTFSCGGIGLGMRISHVVADGTAISDFLFAWSKIALGEEELQNPPSRYFDRAVLKPAEENLPPPSFDHSSDFNNTPPIIGQADEKEERRKETTPVMLKLSKEQIRLLLSHAAAADNNGRPFTMFEVLCAHLWRSTCKARAHQFEQQVALRIVVNIRNRIKPSLPERYFANAVVPVTATTTAGELLAKPLSYACGKIKEVLDKVNDEYVKSSLSYLKHEKDLSRFRYLHVVGTEEGPFFGNPNLAITSWLSFPLKGMDFGWGKDIYAGPGLLGFDGKSFLLPGRDEDGSVVVALRLRVAHMDAFNHFFYGDIPRNSKSDAAEERSEKTNVTP